MVPFQNVTNIIKVFIFLLQENGIMEKSEHQGAINLSAIRESTESLQNGDVLKNGENTEESQVFRNSIKCENSLLL